jgi:hypothetical protein
MPVTVPASDNKNTAKAAEVTAIATALTLQTASHPARDALQQRQQLVNRELVVDLMATGKLNPVTILSTCTYGT